MIIQYANEPLKIEDREFWLREKRETIYWLDDFGPKARLKQWVRDERDLTAREDLNQLWPAVHESAEICPLLKEEIRAGRVFRVNTAHKRFEDWLKHMKQHRQDEEHFYMGEYVGRQRRKKRVHILGLGDVGSTMALALCLYGKEAVSEIGIYDLDENRILRWEQELNQIGEPLEDQLPKVRPLKEAELFDCDVFAFTASVGVPPVSVTEGDVRVIQFAGNAKLVKRFAEMAVAQDYKGLFAIVSDPVDQLCRYAFDVSNRDESGNWHGMGLTPEQIRGYGLGVMNGRAAYYARQDDRSFAPFGRVYGPHGKGLVVANDWRVGHYDADLSQKWTEQTITANLQMRALGYKPYIAPAVASGAISLVKTILGEKHYSCVSFDGFYYGCLNQHIEDLDILERLDADPALKDKILASAKELNEQWQNLL